MSSQCHEQGVVVKLVAGERALVNVHRAASCEQCAARGACLTLGGGAKKISIVVKNPVHAQAGDTVRLSMPELSVVKASTVAYLIPTLGLVIGILAGRFASGLSGISTGAGALVGGLAGIAAAFFIVRRMGSRMSENEKYEPAITQRINTVTVPDKDNVNND